MKQEMEDAVTKELKELFKKIFGDGEIDIHISLNINKLEAKFGTTKIINVKQYKIQTYKENMESCLDNISAKNLTRRT